MVAVLGRYASCFSVRAEECSNALRNLPALYYRSRSVEMHCIFILI